MLKLNDICRPRQWPTISSGELTNHGFPVYGANGQIGYYSEFNHADPTVLITCRGATCGTINICAPKSYVTGNSMALDDLDRRVDISFLAHYLRNRGLNDVISGSAQPQITREGLTKVMVPVPPIEEQRRIAAILDQAEALRAKRRQALAKLNTLTQSLFLEMFGDPSSNNNGLPIRALGELFDEPPCYGTMVPGEAKGKWLVLRVANIQGWEIDLSSRKYVDLPVSLQARHTLRDGDIVLARAIASLDHLGKAIVVRTGNGNWAFDSHLMRLRLDESHILPEYLTTLLQTVGGRNLFLGVTRRSAVQFNVNTKEIASLRVPVPEIESQRRFALRIGTIASQRARFLKTIEQEHYLQGSLQKRAFSGGL